MQVVVTGSLEQTVERGAAFETITFSNVQTFERNTWNMWFMEFKRTGDVVTAEGSVHVGYTQDTAVETVTVNGQKFDISFVVVSPASSSSATSSSSEKPKSSSSETPASSSSEASSSSVEPASSSSEVQPESSSSEGPVFVTSRSVSALSMDVAGRTLHVAGAPDMSVEIFDMQGKPVASFGHVSGSVSLDALCQGSYVVRLRSGSLSIIRRVLVK
jgi:hypothetical protein